MKLIIKTRGHKYKRKWKDKNGKWQYEYSKVASKKSGKSQWIKDRAEQIDALNDPNDFLLERKAEAKRINADMVKQKPKHPKMVVDFDATIERKGVQEKPERTSEQKLIIQFNRFFSELYTGFSITELGVEQWLRKNTTYLEDILNSANSELAFETLTGILKDSWKPRDIGNMIYLNADLNDIKKVRSTLSHMDLLYKDGGGKFDKLAMVNWLRNQNMDWHYFEPYTNSYGETPMSQFERDWGKGIFAGAILAEAYDNRISLEEAKKTLNERYSKRINIGAFYTPDNLKAYLNDKEYTEILAMMSTPFADISPITATAGINESYKALGDTGDFYCVKPRSGEHAEARKNIDTGTYAVREAGAYIIDKAFGFGLVPPTVLRQDKDLGFSSMQLWEEEGDIGSVINYDASINETDKFKASIFDFIVFNTDRHDGNLIVNSFGDVTLIDNGLCMPYEGDNRYSYRSVLHESLVKDLVGGGSFVSTYPPLQIPDTIMANLDNVDIVKLGDTLLKLGIDKESVDLMKNRFNWLIQNETLPGSDDLDVQAWSNL